MKFYFTFLPLHWLNESISFQYSLLTRLLLGFLMLSGGMWIKIGKSLAYIYLLSKISSCVLGKLVNHEGLYLWKASDSREVYKIFKPSNNLLRRIKDKVNLQLLNHLFQMHPFSTPEKMKKPYDFFDVFNGKERVHWEQMG